MISNADKGGTYKAGVDGLCLVTALMKWPPQDSLGNHHYFFRLRPSPSPLNQHAIRKPDRHEAFRPRHEPIKSIRVL